MRGGFVDQGRLFSYVSPEARVPANHPLRTIRAFVRDVLEELNRSLSRLYASEGRPSIPPEKTSFRGRDRVGWAFIFAAAAYNLVRLPKLITQTG